MAKDVSIRLHAQLDSVEKKRSRLDQENEELRVRLQEQEVAKQVLQQEVDKVGLEFCWLKPIFWGTHDNIGGHGYVYDRSFSVENSTFMFRKAQTCKDCSCTLSVGLKQTKFHFSLAANEQTTKRPKYIILKLLLFELITWIKNQPEKHLFLAYRLLGCLLGQFSSFFFLHSEPLESLLQISSRVDFSCDMQLPLQGLFCQTKCGRENTARVENDVKTNWPENKSTLPDVRLSQK